MSQQFLLPGWCLGRGPLQAMSEALGAEIIDLPGYGQRPPEADFDQACANIASELPNASTLVGWSLGAQMALAIAARYPDKVARLLLIAGTASFVQRVGWPAAMPLATLAEFRAGIAADVEAMLPRFVGGFNRGDAASKQVTRELLALADPRPPVSHLLMGLDWLRDVDLRPHCADVTCPTLLIHGAADPLMPFAAAEALAASLPNAKLTAMTNCAHAPFISQPAGFLTIVRAFIDDTAA